MKKFVKTLVVLTSVLVLGLSAERASAQIHLFSDLSWEAGTSMTGPWGPVFDVGPCANNCVLQCLCDEWGPGDALNINTCANAIPIWGTPPPADCLYPPGTFFFRRIFDLEIDDHDPCTIPNGTLLWQADNSSRIWINGQTAANLSSPASGRDTPNGPIDISQYLISGQNEIIVQVNNNNPNGCLNYAFLSLCMDVDVTVITLDPEFHLDSHGIDGGTFLSSTGVQNPAQLHDWYFFSGPEDEGPWTPLGVIPNSMNFSLHFVPECEARRIIQRIYTPGEVPCEGCFERTFRDCGEFKRTEEVVGRIDCAVLNGIEFPPIGFGFDGSYGKVQVGSQPDAGVQLHPNPSKDLLNVTWDKLEVNALKVVDLNGKQLLEQRIDPETNALELDINSLPAGIYLLELSGAYEKVVKKFSVMK